MWSCICFHTTEDLCDESYKVLFDGYEIEVERGASNQGHLMFIEVPNTEYEKAHEAGRRFLSEISWLYGVHSEVLTYGGSGMGKTKFLIQPREFYRIGNALSLTDYEQITTDSKARLALGIYKEGLSSGSHLYSFLCYARIINMCGDGKDQIQWINDNLHKIRDQKALTEYFSKIGVSNIGKHLYVSGRCAIAHAQGSVIIDVDDFQENNRIHKELGFIKELSEIYIKEDLGVMTKWDLQNLRLFRGFKKLLGDSFLNAVFLSQGEVDTSAYPDMPPLSLSLNRNDRAFPLFGQLEFSIISASKGVVILANYSQDWPIHGEIVIDLIKKDIAFDILKTSLNRTHDLFTIEFALDYQLFLKGCFLNGSVEIYLSENNEFIAKLSPYIPCNIRVNWDVIESNIRELENSVAKSVQS